MARIDETAAPVAEKSVESSASAVEWASIFGGRWRTRGDRHSFDSRSGPRVDHGDPWSFNDPSPTTFGTVAAIWLVV
jgi:hypothetical protein